MLHAAEAFERRAEVALQEVADAATRARLGLQAVPVADGLALVAAALPASAITVNRVIGLGLVEPLRPATVEAVVKLYREAGVQRFFIHVHPDARTPEAEAALAQAGLVKTRGWQKFSRDGSPPPPNPPTPLTVREIGDEDGPAFARIVAAAFDLGDLAVDWLARLPKRAGWHAFLAFDGETPAGAGALFVEDDAAWTDFGATAPAYRRRGVQRTLLTERVRFAAEAGCRRLYTCTGEAVPGDPQHSYANILRCGFKEDYVRDNWAPPKPT